MKIKNETPTYIPDTPVSVTIASVRQYIPHYHSDAMEFVYCLNGSVNFTIAHENMTLKTGEIVLVEHDNVHSISSDTDNIIMLIHIDTKKCSCNSLKFRKYPFCDISGIIKKRRFTKS